MINDNIRLKSLVKHAAVGVSYIWCALTFLVFLVLSHAVRVMFAVMLAGIAIHMTVGLACTLLIETAEYAQSLYGSMKRYFHDMVRPFRERYEDHKANTMYTQPDSSHTSVAIQTDLMEGGDGPVFAHVSTLSGANSTEGDETIAYKVAPSAPVYGV